ncbi:MAG: PQQ-binding-like beta-propeller repeat protein, partial [Bacteroidales bacterium]|nr:PQQ-binding-like beta-propeller repeat protein [Bacteroidales bacterium]
MKKTLISALLICCAIITSAQTSPVRFAYFADTHLTIDSPRNDELLKCINDINSNNEGIQFAILGGDITEFGADNEIALAKSIIDKLNIPYYIVAGNHDAKWSESGCNTFAKVFGYENFEFEAGGVRFLGSNSGPNMRMAPALLPHESLVWLDSIAKVIPKEQPVIFVNHYPQDTSMLNYFQVMNTLKQTNIQLLIGGHWHNNTILNYMGVPGILGRSPAVHKGAGIGYNIITIDNGVISVQERIAADSQGNGGETRKAWFTLKMSDKPQYTPAVASRNNPFGLPEDFPWLTFDVNMQYRQVKTIWQSQDESDIGCGATPAGKYVVYANTQGVIKALNAKTGELKWKFATDGKIFSTPAVSGNRVITGSTDGYVYCLNLKNGKLLWKYKCDKSVLASAAIFRGKAYIGASDGIFRAIDIKSGKLVWRYDKVKGFVESRPYVDERQVVFGDWGNTLYSLDTENGECQWTWHNKGTRMFSPAAVYPVKSNGSIYFVTPERKTYCLDASDGKQLWVADGGRESIALSKDGSLIFVKNMFNSMQAYSTVNGEDRGGMADKSAHVDQAGGSALAGRGDA